MWIIPIKRVDILALTQTEDSAIAWCQSQGILNNNPDCSKWGSEMRQLLRNNYYRCANTSCRAKKSIKSGTIFDNSKITISKCVLLLYEWSVETPIFRAAHEYDLSEKTVSTWYEKFREFASFFCVTANDSRIGGDGIIVEIDECLVAKRKYNRGRLLQNQKWIFGGVVRGDNTQCFVEFVADRSRATLLEVIRRWVLSGIIIHSECWRAYLDLPLHVPEVNITHRIVNHSVGFLNPDNPDVYTQNTVLAIMCRLIHYGTNI